MLLSNHIKVNKYQIHLMLVVWNGSKLKYVYILFYGKVQFFVQKFARKNWITVRCTNVLKSKLYVFSNVINVALATCLKDRLLQKEVRFYCHFFLKKSMNFDLFLLKFIKKTSLYIFYIVCIQGVRIKLLAARLS